MQSSIKPARGIAPTGRIQTTPVTPHGGGIEPAASSTRAAVAAPRERFRGASGTRSTWPVVCWTLSACALLTMLRQLDPASPATYAALDVELPGLTEAALTASLYLRDTGGLLIVVGSLVATGLPFALGARGRIAARLYFALALFAFAGVAGTWLAVHRPLEALRHKLEVPVDPLGR